MGETLVVLLLLAPILSEAVSDVAAAAARIRVDVAFTTALPGKGGLGIPALLWLIEQTAIVLLLEESSMPLQILSR